jgi:hypothetical protein
MVTNGASGIGIMVERDTAAYREQEQLRLLEKIYSLLLEKQSVLVKGMKTDDSYLRTLYLRKAREIDGRVKDFSSQLDLLKVKTI